MTRKATPAASRAAAMAIVRSLRKAGHIAYFAGGCVRDELLGLSPTDYDVATDATPDRIKATFKRTNEVGEAFGVVLVTPTQAEGAPEPATVEVATFRSDGPYTDRRRPDAVTFSDPKSDAMRRDFTVNSLFLDPLADPEAGSRVAGRVIDYVGGREDLGRKLIRAVGDAEARLAEDHLRALRAVRLAARLGFAIDAATAGAITRHASDLHGVSRERIGEEVRRMLAHSTRAEATRLLEALSLDAPVLDEPHTSSRTRVLAQLSEGQGNASYPTCLAAWACDRGLTLTASSVEAIAGRWRRALCLSNEDRAELVAVLGALSILETNWSSLGVAAQKRLAGAHGGFAGAMAVLRGRNGEGAASVRSRVDALSATPSGLCPEPLVTGDDLIRAGMKPGPKFKKVLDSVYDAQLEDRVKTVSEALELARTMGV